MLILSGPSEVTEGSSIVLDVVVVGNPIHDIFLSVGIEESAEDNPFATTGI